MSNNQEHQDQINLTTDDLKTLLNVVDLACQRGAYKPTEFVSVGQVYGKVSKFVEHANIQERLAHEQAQKEAQLAEAPQDAPAQPDTKESKSKKSNAGKE